MVLEFAAGQAPATVLRRPPTNCIKPYFLDRGEIASRRAVRNIDLCMDIFDVGQIMLHLFGVGAGRVLHRQVAELLRDDLEPKRAEKPSESGGTRPMAHASCVCESLIRNNRTYHAGLEARLALTRGESIDGKKRGSQTTRTLVEVGWRLASEDFVAFLLLWCFRRAKKCFSLGIPCGHNIRRVGVRG